MTDNAKMPIYSPSDNSSRWGRLMTTIVITKKSRHHMIMPMGDTFSFLQMTIATGATMSTVATLSMNAEMSPENMDMRTVTHKMLGAILRSDSAMTLGILDSMK